MKGTDRQAIALCRQAPSETTNREVFSKSGVRKLSTAENTSTKRRESLGLRKSARGRVRYAPGMSPYVHAKTAC